MQLIYLSPLPWSSFAQRPHKFVEWFHDVTGGAIIWIDPYPTRFPVASDFKRIAHAVSSPIPKIPDWLCVIQPAALPIEPLPASAIVNGVFWLRIFKRLKQFSATDETLLVVGKPSLLALAIMRSLPMLRTVYDAMDDFPAFYSGVSRVAMRMREERLVRQVNSLMVSSSVLKQRWIKSRADVLLVRNGLDSTALPIVQPKLPVRDQVVFGYVGTIASWFDWQWTIELARLRPNDLIRLIGPVFCSTPDRLPANIEILPACDHSAALRAMQELDVGLIPFLSNKLTLSVDPIKYYEYRALGLPVISTDFGEMSFRQGEDGVFLSKNLADLGQTIEQALMFQPSSHATLQFQVDNSWQARFASAQLI